MSQQTHHEKPKRSLKDYWTLFITFLKIGAFTFGGGYAMIPLIQREVVENQHWIENEDMLDVLVIAQSAPGPIAINSAAFVGYKVGRFWGSACATVGVVLPSFVCLVIISLFLDQFMQNRWFGYAFEGIRAGVVVLIINAVIKLSQSCRKGAFNLIIIMAAFGLTTFLHVNAMWVLLGGAALGVVYRLFIVKDEQKAGAQ